MVVVDTHALLWFLTGDKKLGQLALKKLKDAEAGKLHDRLVVATARINRAPLITLDPEIKRYGKVKIIW